MTHIEKLQKPEIEWIPTSRLLELGFIEYPSDDFLERPLFRIKPDKKYPFEIQIRLGDYPADNPNCGIVSIHHPAHKVQTVPEDLFDKEDWTEEDKKRAENYMEDAEDWTQPIAWYVNNEKRLLEICKALIGEEDFDKLFSTKW